MKIRKATLADAAAVTELALLLWSGHTYEELLEEFTAMLAGTEAAIFLAFRSGEAVAFAQCQLRRDYVEGTDSSPVGYLEGIYVTEGMRHQGIARGLLAACEGWSKEMGCVEFASDCELTNTESLRFHLSVGFTEANRIICFTKKLQ